MKHFPVDSMELGIPVGTEVIIKIPFLKRIAILLKTEKYYKYSRVYICSPLNKGSYLVKMKYTYTKYTNCGGYCSSSDPITITNYWRIKQESIYEVNDFI